MTVAVANPRVTPEDLLEQEGGYEFLDGRLVERPVSRSSTSTSLKAASEFLAFLDEHPLRELFDAGLGIQIFPDPQRTRKADLSFVRAQRLPDGDFGFLRVPPDLVVEVISPSNRGNEIRAKVDEWLDAGVTEVWVLYPFAREVYVYRRDARPRVFAAGDRIESPVILPGFGIAVERLFPSSLAAIKSDG